jgi:hypothetical protein
MNYKMNNKIMINLKDPTDNTYLLGVMGEGWTYDPEKAYLFTKTSAWFYKIYLRLVEGLKLDIVTRVVFY